LPELDAKGEGLKKETVAVKRFHPTKRKVKKDLKREVSRGVQGETKTGEGPQKRGGEASST